MPGCNLRSCRDCVQWLCDRENERQDRQMGADDALGRAGRERVSCSQAERGRRLQVPSSSRKRPRSK